ncbi:MAG: Histidyl-tRNA synthetase (EC [uncultured Thiotrichaceae bacterium]|uniref:Histidine--tRNA ligase n=1 Tax=uncultured Thiotrichaceae bacterium TaxID=298394 RepID=A0A6S6T4D3_9GAMM|nr:MAG: Histidyl-tRNA synthetase (EC [uncultured Thiotrichaceae bacterium]
MAKNIQSIRGVHDILPEQSAAWQHLEETVRSLLAEYGYSEIRTPILESTELFHRGVGEVTDIVEKEMYAFADRNGDSIALRPENTASCVRACIQHGLLHNQQQRIWYAGPMFRRERPQKGRYRQFHQVGAETFNIPGPDIDAELIAMTARLWQRLGLKNIRLELNSLGTPESRAAYRALLTEHFSAHEELLDEDSKRRLHTNPLRILDTKNPAMRDLVAAAPDLHDHLDQESADHFADLCRMLDMMGIDYIINPRLVRGLDYYTRTVFEWITDELGAQGTVCGGGRYDGLVEQLGGKSTPGCGFAMGTERLLELMQAQGIENQQTTTDIYMVLVGNEAIQTGMALAEQLRTALPGLQLLMNAGGGSFKSQMKRADKSTATYALIMGEEEARNGQINIKPLRDKDAQQQIMSIDGLAEQLQSLL